MPKNPIARYLNKFNRPKVIPDKRRKARDKEAIENYREQIKDAKYYEEFDAHWNGGKWIETICHDDECTFCKDRPEKPDAD